jgi:hypothetical protein
MSDVSEASNEAGPEPGGPQAAVDADQEGAVQADQFVEELIIGLEQAAKGETDPEISSRLRGAAAILETVGRNVTTEIAAKIIVHIMDL